jgi:hypothetical protein
MTIHGNKGIMTPLYKKGVDGTDQVGEIRDRNLPRVKEVMTSSARDLVVANHALTRCEPPEGCCLHKCNRKNNSNRSNQTIFINTAIHSSC